MIFFLSDNLRKLLAEIFCDPSPLRKAILNLKMKSVTNLTADVV
jgi:hypothetical protein